jgi:hypothetical protein
VSTQTLPHLSRSARHRCLQRHGISQLPKEKSLEKKKFKPYPIGYFHVDIAEVQTEEGKLYLFSALIGLQSLPTLNCTRKRPELQPKSFSNI